VTYDNAKVATVYKQATANRPKNPRCVDVENRKVYKNPRMKLQIV